ncbi:TerC family protein [Thermaerobacillus caldiproteolyticus]|uniref:YjbE family integral membrane protein n=1 Tax=Thermaerobacillus caldiproteolyticus TaxID=247480 RepID=A0A7V9Z6Q2_9BACL|nr:TerC family protein [Anoxybacillus caldiproteolyticus]MBA2874933.1 YjbE family integral membrane protein [Anoxybacillus caldiproteolyticus]QPA31731.1 TerC family protein [Anoxybacillus caldiproteolyticus]
MNEYITSILLIISIDIILGGDNAVVIALASRNLPEHKRNTAIVLGTTLAIVVRIFLTAIVVVLLKIPFLQFIGGFILLWISLKLLIQKEDTAAHVKPETSLWKAVQTIVTADIVMGLDNVIAIAGAAGGRTSLVIFGFLISVPIIILGSKIILYSMERFPFLIYIGAAILAYTAGKMITEEQQIQHVYGEMDSLRSAFPFITTILIVCLGFIINWKKAHRWTS